MGYIAHHAIVVTAGSREVRIARKKALGLGLHCSGPVPSPVNGYVSFLIAPDGSKEGWGESAHGDDARAEWIAWTKTQDRLYLHWALVRFGGDQPELTRVERHNGSH